MVKTKKIIITKKNKSKKSKKLFVGGAAGKVMGVLDGITKTAANAVGITEKCNLAIDFTGNLESKLYSPQKLSRTLLKLKFTKNEPELFKKFFNANASEFCVKLDSKRHLKFCSNLFNCLKNAQKFYEVLYDIFNITDKQPLTKQLYENKKKQDKSLTMEKFLKDEKKLRIKTMSAFVVDVIFKSVKQYERKHPPKTAPPDKKLVFKEKFIKFFENIGFEIKEMKIDKNEFEKLLIDKEVSIVDYYLTRTSPDDASTSTVSNQDKRAPTFLKLLVGAVGAILLIQTGWFDSAPGVPGGIS